MAVWFYPKKVKLRGLVARDKKVNIIFDPANTSLPVSIVYNTDSEYIYLLHIYTYSEYSGYIYIYRIHIWIVLFLDIRKSTLLKTN